MKIGCVIMASGMSKRFGSNKLLCDFRGKPMMVQILRSIKQAGIRPSVAVTRHPEIAQLCEAEGIPAILHELPLRSDTVRLGTEHLLEVCPELDGILRWAGCGTGLHPPAEFRGDCRQSGAVSQMGFRRALPPPGGERRRCGHQGPPRTGADGGSQ